jgi:hypothetical protein
VNIQDAAVTPLTKVLAPLCTRGIDDSNERVRDATVQLLTTLRQFKIIKVFTDAYFVQPTTCPQLFSGSTFYHSIVCWRAWPSSQKHTSVDRSSRCFNTPS